MNGYLFLDGRDGIWIVMGLHLQNAGKRDYRKGRCQQRLTTVSTTCRGMLRIGHKVQYNSLATVHCTVMSHFQYKPSRINGSNSFLLATFSSCYYQR